MIDILKVKLIYYSHFGYTKLVSEQISERLKFRGFDVYELSLIHILHCLYQSPYSDCRGGLQLPLALVKALCRIGEY